MRVRSAGRVGGRGRGRGRGCGEWVFATSIGHKCQGGQGAARRPDKCLVTLISRSGGHSSTGASAALSVLHPLTGDIDA